MTTPIDERDQALMTKLVDEQLAPYRQLGYALLVLAAVSFIVTFLEWNDANAASEQLVIPTSALIAFFVGDTFLTVAILAVIRNKNTQAHPLYDAMVTHRAQVQSFEVVRVLNRSHDQILIHTPRRARPIVLLVKHQDREDVTALLSRAYAHLAHRERPDYCAR